MNKLTKSDTKERLISMVETTKNQVVKLIDNPSLESISYIHVFCEETLNYLSNGNYIQKENGNLHWSESLMSTLELLANRACELCTEDDLKNQMNTILNNAGLIIGACIVHNIKHPEELSLN